MDIRWLEDFCALCYAGNFSRAAEQRNLTQPAFSRHIQALEAWVGAPLFQRATHPIALTAAGEQFRPLAETVLLRLYQAREQAQLAAAAKAATLRFAATHSLSLTFFPQWIRTIEERSQPLPIRLDSDTMQSCEVLIQQGQCHFLLCHSDPDAPSLFDRQHFESWKVGAETLIPVAAADLPGVELSPEPAEAQRIPYLAYSSASALGKAVERKLAGTIMPRHFDQVFISHLAVVLRSMVRDRKGMAWLPKSLVEEDLRTGFLRQVGGPEWTIPLDIRVYRPRAVLPRDAEAFWALLTGGGVTRTSGQSAS